MSFVFFFFREVTKPRFHIWELQVQLQRTSTFPIAPLFLPRCHCSVLLTEHSLHRKSVLNLSNGASKRVRLGQNVHRLVYILHFWKMQIISYVMTCRQTRSRRGVDFKENGRTEREKEEKGEAEIIKEIGIEEEQDCQWSEVASHLFTPV